MDASLTPSTTATTATGSTKSFEPKPDTLSRAIAQPAKPAHFTNGILKRPNGHAPTIAVSYKECLRNHAASLGVHALDGCLEFMPSPTSATSDVPTSHECAACGCHRNFHRRELDHPAATALPLRLKYQSHHRHHPPPPPPPPQPLHPPALLHSPSSASPPPISSHPLSLAPNMLLPPQGMAMRKRFRTKFSKSQKERMFELAERVGWRMPKQDDGVFREFCYKVGVSRSVFKVWMHNNKNTFGKPRVIDHFGNGSRNATSNVNPVGNEDSPN